MVQGYFNVVLDQDNGFTDCTDTTPDGDGLAAPVSTAFTAALRYVEVAVWNETGSVWEPILPRQHVLSAPYAVSADRSREVVSAEGQPTRIACKTGPSTEVDVVTVSETGVEVTGDLSVEGVVGITGPVGVDGDLAVTGELTVGHLTILEDPAVLVSRTAISSLSGCPGANHSRILRDPQRHGHDGWSSGGHHRSRCRERRCLDLGRYGQFRSIQSRCGGHESIRPGLADNGEQLVAARQSG